MPAVGEQTSTLKRDLTKKTKVKLSEDKTQIILKYVLCHICYKKTDFSHILSVCSFNTGHRCRENGGFDSLV